MGKSKQDIIRFFQNINRLKRIPRTGWVLKGVKKPESVAEHSFRVAILAYALTKDIAHVDTDKLVKMALIHETGEIFAGDIPTGRYFESRKDIWSVNIDWKQNQSKRFLGIFQLS